MTDCLAYFLTFRTYGSWLHGDARGSVHWTKDGPAFEPEANPDIERMSRERLLAPPLTFTAVQRNVVRRAIHETAASRGWSLFAENVRTNHVHVVVRAPDDPPEKVMNSLKSYATRYLRSDGCAPDGSVWARHGSTRYVWDERGLEAACWYVEYGQEKPAD